LQNAIVLRRATWNYRALKISWHPCHSWIWRWKCLSKSWNCFENNADYGSIYSKLRKTDSFLPPRLYESGEIVWSSFEYRKGRNRECWLWWNHEI